MTQTKAMPLPTIVGMGGVNAAGRTSFHQGFRRIVISKLNAEARKDTFFGLATLMNLVKVDESGKLSDKDGNPISHGQIESKFGQQILDGTLIRKIENNHFDPDATPWQKKMTLAPAEGEGITFITKAKELPSPLPMTWTVTELEDGQVKVQIPDNLEVKVDATLDNPIKAAGQLPTGFEPSELYNSRFQPRGLQLTIFGASDAIYSTGIDWQDIMDKVTPDQVGAYASSTMGQMHAEGFGGMMQNRLKGERVTTKNLALGLNTMVTDFINAYVTGSVGTTQTSTGACATFLYNLNNAVKDIKAGRTRVAIVGAADGLVTQEVIEGFGNMSALANEEGLKKLDGTDTVDHRRTSRPFGENCGFTIGEGAQFFVMMDDDLALEMGANVMGSVPEVFINADGIKKSITAPGPGNYITMAKSVALATAMLGEESVQERSFILAHGSSTPQNRVTESAIYDRLANAFNINNWPVAAPKAYVGHTIGPASGDQMAWALGVFEDQIIPGITTIDKVADDVYSERLNIALDHYDCGQKDVAFVNSKGFGGNNATATVLSGKVTLEMMAERHGAETLVDYQAKLEQVKANQRHYEERADQGHFDLIYRFGKGMIDESQIEIDKHSLRLPGFEKAVDLAIENPFADMFKA